MEDVALNGVGHFPSYLIELKALIYFHYKYFQFNQSLAIDLIMLIKQIAFA